MWFLTPQKSCSNINSMFCLLIYECCSSEIYSSSSALAHTVQWARILSDLAFYYSCISIHVFKIFLKRSSDNTQSAKIKTYFNSSWCLDFKEMNRFKSSNALLIHISFSKGSYLFKVIVNFADAYNKIVMRIKCREI